MRLLGYALLISITLALVLLGISVFTWRMAEPERYLRADAIHVDKSDRRLELLQDGKVIRGYRVSFGANPRGHKQREGDERTPEGHYRIDWRNPGSKFHKSLHISYPGARDRAEARAKGVSPGGDIMIHGMPNGWGWAWIFLKLFNWTDGCIAVSDREIEEIWAAVPDGTPIEIRP